MKPRLWTALLLAACLFDVFAGCACDPNTIPLSLQAGAPEGVSGTGADSDAVKAALAELMTDRIYDPGTYVVYACSPTNRSRINNGTVSTFVINDSTFERGPNSLGTGQGSGVYYTMTFTMPEGQSLSVKFIYNMGQQLITEVVPDGGGQYSSTTTDAECRLTGSLAGQAVDLAFTQELKGVAGVGNAGH